MLFGWLRTIGFAGLLLGRTGLCDQGGVALQRPAGTAAQANHSADYEAGERAFAARRWREAAQMFARAAAAEGVRADSEHGTGAEAAHTDALWMEARCLVNLADYPGAESALRLALGQEPKSARALYLLGMVLQRENQPKASLQTFTEAARVARPSGEDLRIVALDYVLLADYPDAIHWLGSALQADPANAEAWYDLARAHMHDGKFADAEAELRRSLTIAPGSAKAWDNVGVCLEAQNRQQDALAAYQKAIAAEEASGHPGGQPFVDLGTLLNTRNEFARANALLLRATKLSDGNSAGFAELARSYVGLGETAKAQAAMERAVSLDPKNSRLHFQLGRIYRSNGLVEKAKDEFKLSSKMYGEHSTE